MRELAIDFGTSNTVAALRVDGAAPRLLSVDGRPVLPSAVWLSPDGTLVVGRDAERQARLDPSRFEPNPKRRIDEVDVLLGDTVVPVVELIAAVLRSVLDEARRQLGGRPDRVVLTHPAGWGTIRTNTLAAAARRAGSTGAVQLLPEPVAAAAHFAGLSDPGEWHICPIEPAECAIHPRGEAGGVRALAVFDLGGGTTDTAVVARTADGWQVLAEAGLGDVGGTDLDQLLLEHIGRQVGGAADPTWQALLRPSDAASRRAARTLADDVRAAKEALSRYPNADVPLPPPLADAHVTRAELESLVRPRLERTAALCASTIAVAGLHPRSLTGVYLVGGGSRMPLVAQLLAERIGVLPVAVESPESSVALGALVAPPQREFTHPLDGNTGAATAAGPGPAGSSGPTGFGGPLGSGGSTGPGGSGGPGGYAQPVFTGPVARLPSAGPSTGTRPTDTRPVQTAPGRRRGPRVVAATIGAVVVAAVAAVVIATQLGGDPGDPDDSAGRSTTPTATSTASTGTASSTGSTPDLGGATPPDAVPVEAAVKEQPFNGDTALREFAGPAVDRAINCADPGGTAKFTLGLRTQVQCVYKLGDDLYYASFLSSDSELACQQLASTMVLAGTNVSDGEWDGGGRTGTWKDATLSTPTTNNVTYYADSGGLLCGLVESDDEEPLELSDIHDQWYVAVRPGS